MQAMALLSELRAAGDAVDAAILNKLQRACLKANMVDDAAQVTRGRPMCGTWKAHAWHVEGPCVARGRPMRGTCKADE